MSREQRRQQSRGSSGGSRTPQKAPGGSGVPWGPIAIVGGAVLIVALIVYLVIQSTGSDDALGEDEQAEQDSSPDLAGTFVPSQGRGHFNFSFSLERTPTAFCEGVIWSGAPEGQPGTATAGTTATPAATTATPQATGTTSGTSTSGTPEVSATPTPRTDCYASNPPSSGQHLGVQRNVDVTGNGDLINIPADPDVYPEDIQMPRESIPHILEHSGVYVGYNCPEGDQACADAVQELADLVNDRIDNHDDRVVMARDEDLPEGYFGIASWTRFIQTPYEEYEQDVFETFISDHACRFDPEGFCG